MWIRDDHRESVQGMIRTSRSAIERPWDVQKDATHCVWLWIADPAGFLFTRFEVGRHGRTAYERLKGKSSKVQGVSLAEGILWKSGRAGVPLGEIDVHVGVWRVSGHQSNHGKGHRGELELERRVAHKHGQEEDR